MVILPNIVAECSTPKLHSLETPNPPFMCEKHPLSNICTSSDDPSNVINERHSNYKIFRSEEKNKTEAEEACKHIGQDWNLAFLKSKEWNHF